MKPLFIAIACLLSVTVALAQPRLKWDAEEIDFGCVVQGEHCGIKVWFTNVGNEPLQILNAKTSDGGTSARAGIDPVLPGERDYVLFSCHTGNVRTVNKSLVVVTNAPDSAGRVMSAIVKGEVIFPPTLLVADMSEVNVGELPFGETTTVTFDLENMGGYDLVERSVIWDRTGPDVESVRLSFSGLWVQESSDHHGFRCPPGGHVEVTVKLTNWLGDMGPVERVLVLHPNRCDTLRLTVRANYTGKATFESLQIKEPFQTKMLYYSQGRLAREEEFDSRGELWRESLYDGAEMTLTRQKGWKCWWEYRYQKGVLVEKRQLPE